MELFDHRFFVLVIFDGVQQFLAQFTFRRRRVGRLRNSTAVVIVAAGDAATGRRIPCEMRRKRIRIDGQSRLFRAAVPGVVYVCVCFGRDCFSGGLSRVDAAVDAVGTALSSLGAVGATRAFFDWFSVVRIDFRVVGAT